MGTTDIIMIVGGMMVSVISYFLKTTMDDLKNVKEMSFDTKNKLAVLENDHINKHNSLSDKFDELKLALMELTKELKELNKRDK